MSSSPRRTVLGLVVLLALWALILGAVWKVKQPFASAAACTPGRVAPERLRADVRHLSEALVPRDADHPEGMARAAAFVAERLQQAGGRVREEAYTARLATYRNVVATFGPEDGERVVVGAHYDTADALPGADDNASGVAGLLALAQLLGQRPPPMRVDLVAFALEEPPAFRTQHMGSAVHARALRQAGTPVKVMLSLETLGTFSDAPGSQEYPVATLRALYPGTGNFIAVVGRFGEEALARTVKGAMAGATSLPVESLNAPRSLRGVDYSDHRSFWAEGYPALMVTDTAFLRNPRYHTPQDTWDTLDYERMAQVVQGVECAVRALAAGG